MFGRNRWLDSVLTGLIGYGLMLGWAACSSSGAGGGFAPDGGSDAQIGGGGSNPVLPEAHAEQSGNRLKARRLHGADGSSQFIGWTDTARNEECSFNRAADGTYRCLPSGPSVEYSSGSYFVDPSCTVPGVDRKAGCPPAKYLALYADSSSCSGGGIAAVFPLQPAGQLFYKNGDGQCSPESASPGYAIYGAGNPIPWTDFLQSEEKLDP